MKLFPATAYSYLNQYGLWTMAEFVRTVADQGSQLKDGREPQYGGTLRGLAQWFISPVTREEINRTIRNSVIYREGDCRDPFKGRSNGFKTQIHRMKTLISRSPLSDQELKIFDAACNHGHIAEHLDQRIRRYYGMDTFDEIIESAWKEAVERFEKIGCSDYSFVQGNILLRSSYKGLPQDNNLAICTGVMGHFRPYQISRLVDNLTDMIDHSGNSRIIIGIPVIPKDYDSTGFIITTDQFGNVMPKPRREEDGIRYIVQRSKTGLSNFEFRRYERDDIVNLIQQNKRLEIADIIEPSEELQNVYLCLKKNKANLK